MVSSFRVLRFSSVPLFDSVDLGLFTLFQSWLCSGPPQVSGRAHPSNLQAGNNLSLGSARPQLSMLGRDVSEARSLRRDSVSAELLRMFFVGLIGHSICSLGARPPDQSVSVP
ncbi:hypothetical protein BJX64DRAFT_251322 [Aspergillus heterothallicus]